MSESTIDRLRPRIGDSVESVCGLTVGAGKVAEFAAATGADADVFVDPAGAEAERRDAVPAPLTFTRTAMFPRYRPADVDRLGFDLGFDIRYELHGEQAYEFERPLSVGDTLSGTTTLTDAYERDGRQGGAMTFAVLETEYVDEDEDSVVTERSTLIETSDAVDGTSTEEGSYTESAHTSTTAAVSGPADGFDRPTSVDEVEVGDAGPTVTVTGVSRRDFVRYAGASGDFNPIHYDESYARKLGNPRVFGQGMLTAGWAARMVSDWFGVRNVRQFRTRFTARVWPGDTVTVQGEVADVAPTTVTAEITATRQTGDVVLAGDVTAALPT